MLACLHNRKNARTQDKKAKKPSAYSGTIRTQRTKLQSKTTPLQPKCKAQAKNADISDTDTKLAPIQRPNTQLASKKHPQGWTLALHPHNVVFRIERRHVLTFAGKRYLLYTEKL